ncbi:MAG: helix-turn-helix domain-containing protein [Clostridia bacterium]|nr:helix-turn-helix domain-containing protein [Clostridia bacterium]
MDKRKMYTVDTGKGRVNNSILPSMNLSTASDVMRSNVSWCRVVNSDEETMTTREHKHMVHEFHYIYEGGLRFCNEETFECHPGDYIFIPSGVPHSIEDIAPFTRKLVIGFDISSHNEIINKIFNETRVPLSRPGTPAFHELARALLHKSSTIDLTTSVSIACIVHTLLLEIADSLASNISVDNKSHRMRESEDSQRIDQILSFINENVFNSVTIDDVAKAVSLSTRQTTRICHRLFGCSLNKLIIQVRLKQICTLLIDSKYSISEIAEIAGFSSPYSFSRHFSHYTGTTPSAYRHNYEIRH